MDPVLVFALFMFLQNDVIMRIKAVPLSALNPIGSDANSISDDDSSGAEDQDAPVDDFTTHGLERLSSAATCLVAGVEYTHGQQIYRMDPCEFCLCLDGEMFCWWQDCPPTMEGPCKDRGPFTPCLNDISTPATSIPLTKTTITHETTSLSYPTDVTSENETDSSTEEAETHYSTDESSTVQQNSKICIIMGQKYQIGDKLPHDTGNCVECICGMGAKVTCSPHHCAPEGEDINDYRPPGPRQQVADVF